MLITANGQLLEPYALIQELDINTKDSFSGIYAIYNQINRKIYVGLSRFVYGRMRDHIVDLDKKIHKNIYLQNSWNKYGDKNFTFYLLEVCKENELSNKEIRYIDLYQSANTKYGYNMTAGGEGSVGYKHSEESRLKLSKSTKKRLSNKENHPLYNKTHSETSKRKMSNKKREKSKRVVQLDLDCNYIKTWNNVFEIIENLEYITEKDRANLLGCCVGRAYSTKGFRWLYEDDYLNDKSHFHNQKSKTPKKEKLLSMIL